MRMKEKGSGEKIVSEMENQTNSYTWVAQRQSTWFYYIFLLENWEDMARKSLFADNRIVRARERSCDIELEKTHGKKIRGISKKLSTIDRLSSYRHDSGGGFHFPKENRIRLSHWSFRSLMILRSVETRTRRAKKTKARRRAIFYLKIVLFPSSRSLSLSFSLAFPYFHFDLIVSLYFSIQLFFLPRDFSSKSSRGLQLEHLFIERVLVVHFFYVIFLRPHRSGKIVPGKKLYHG